MDDNTAATATLYPAAAFACANCEIGIDGRPTIHVGLPFCCAGCVAGGPCICSYDPPSSRADDAARLEPAGVRSQHWQVHDCLDVTALDGEAAVGDVRRRRERELATTRR
jgi:hypothetical protein